LFNVSGIQPFREKWCGVLRQAIFRTLQSQGQLVEQTVEQLYSEAAGKFLADRYVYGTCPKCAYEVRTLLCIRVSNSFTSTLSNGGLFSIDPWGDSMGVLCTGGKPVSAKPGLTRSF
jgi:hypothetical protein